MKYLKEIKKEKKVQTIENPIFNLPENYDDNSYYSEYDLYSFTTEIKPNIKTKDNYQRMKRIREGIRPKTNCV